jgi:hypothetical protein
MSPVIRSDAFPDGRIVRINVGDLDPYEIAILPVREPDSFGFVTGRKHRKTAGNRLATDQTARPALEEGVPTAAHDIDHVETLFGVRLGEFVGV